MKKKLLTTLLIGATLGTTISGLGTKSVNACDLTHYETMATPGCHPGPGGVIMGITSNNRFYKYYPSYNWCDYIVEYGNGHVDELYFINKITQKPQTGLYRNGSDYYYLNSQGKAISCTKTIGMYTYRFDANNGFKGTRI